MKISFFKDLENFFTLLMINFKVKFKNLIEFLQVAIKYYPHWNFLKIDLSLLFSYFFNSPFHINKAFLMQKGEKDIYTYGETPLTTLEVIARTCQFSEHDVIFELGCGRGRTCFWLNQFIRCSVVGIDHVPTFIEKACAIKNRFHLEKLSFQLADLLQVDLKNATLIYLYGTCFSANFIEELIRRFDHLRKGTKIITVSYTLIDYKPKAPYKIVKQFLASFTWGQAIVYLQIKTR